MPRRSATAYHDSMIIADSAPDRIDELRISLGAGTGDSTLVSVGEQQFGEFRIPFSRPEVEEALADRSPNRVSTDPLISIGSTLFNALFAGPLGRELWARLADVESRNRGLRFRIESNLERLQHLPWELLFDPSRGDFMS